MENSHLPSCSASPLMITIYNPPCQQTVPKEIEIIRNGLYFFHNTCIASVCESFLTAKSKWIKHLLAIDRQCLLVTCNEHSSFICSKQRLACLHVYKYKIGKRLWHCTSNNDLSNTTDPRDPVVIAPYLVFLVLKRKHVF